ncbi:MAG TPA: glycosyltransferase family 39 protein [Acidobacteriaceae bacterium]|nr:glycosyltransferase family 39 protein [Acidobacteriaceae bacterium]
MRSSANSRTLIKAGKRPRKPAEDPERLALRGETFVVAWTSVLVSLFALSYCFSRNLLLLSGDAVAHINIARRLVDSTNPGISQLGSVWLPLPHLLIVPFVLRMSWWQSGLAGAFPSIGAFVLGAAGIYRLARIWLKSQPAIVAVLFFALNPGLLYAQTTALNEPLCLAEMIWAVVFLVEYLRALDRDEIDRAAKLLIACGLVLVCSVYTRYDGWIFTFFAGVIAAVPMLRRRDLWRSRFGGVFVLFTVMLVVAPLVWMGYCARQFGDPLDFLRGPYSARAIEIRTTAPGSPHYPGWHNMFVAALFFLKAAELGAIWKHLTNLLLVLAVVGSVFAGVRFRSKHILPMLLLWLPLPFYAYSVAYGSVPIFIPRWWPHSFYNTRYGMEMLPVFALALGFLAAWAAGGVAKRWPIWRPWTLAAFAVLICANSYVLVRATPLVLREMIANSRTRIPFEVGYARGLQSLAPGSTILAYISDHPGAYQRAGVALKRTINESDYYRWKPALRDPAAAADYVITTDGDPVAKAVAAHPADLTLIDIVCSTGQPCVRIYHSDIHKASNSNSHG